MGVELALQFGAGFFCIGAVGAAEQQQGFENVAAQAQVVAVSGRGAVGQILLHVFLQVLALFHRFDDLPGGKLPLLRFIRGIEFAGKFEDAAEQRLDLPRIQAGNVGIERRRGVGQAAVVGRFVIEQRGRQEEGVADGFDARFV